MAFSFLNINSNIVVENNVIDKSAWTDGLTPTVYKYDHCAHIYGSAKIEGNTFANPNVGADMLKTQTGSCTIRNNKFIRNDTTISTYIKHVYTDGSGIHNITENVFDNSTVDGTSEKLVSGLNVGSIYTRNRNQTGFIYIPVYNNDRAQLSFIALAHDQFQNTNTNVFNYTQYKNNSLVTTLETASNSPSSPNTLLFHRTIQLDEWLEPGMQVAQIGMGAFIPTGTVDPGLLSSHRWSAQVNSFNGSVNMDAQHPLAAGALPQSSVIVQYDINSAAKVTDMSATTQYVYGGPSYFPDPPSDFFGFINPDNFRCGNGYKLELTIFAFITFTTTWSFRMSPIEIKYIW